MKVYQGSFIGNGESGHIIKVPFQPSMVFLIRADSAGKAIFRTSGMAANQSSYFEATADLSTGILDLTVDGFTVGTSTLANDTGVEYHFLALAGESDDVEVGTYVGNATNDRSISWSGSHAAAPRLMWIKKENAAVAVTLRGANDTGDASHVLSNTPLIDQTNLIQATSSSAFEIGDDTDVNDDGVTYHYVAIFADTDWMDDGTYTGDGTSNRELKNFDINSNFALIFNKTLATDFQIRFKTQRSEGSFKLNDTGAINTSGIKQIYRNDAKIGSDGSVNTDGSTYHYYLFRTSDMGRDEKYDVKIDGIGYVIQRNSNGRILYEKKPAPNFVNKFGSGDSSYRDSSFWQFWAQVNWRNGSKQLRFDDAGKFWKSENVDVTQLEKIRLSRKMTSLGQVEADAAITVQTAFRASQNWWDANYSYRKQLTITAPASKQLPKGYSIVVTEDTAALETASKVRSDRKDWRVVYWNGTDWEDLDRDYCSTTRTVFALQESLAASSNTTDYYVYYGYASESTDKQPTTDATWNSVYGMYGGTDGETIDANTLAVWHGKEGSGTTIEDTDSGSFDLTGTATLTRGTDGPFGRNVTVASGGGETTSPGISSGSLDVGSFTLEWFIKRQGADYNINANYGRDSDGPTVKFKIQSAGGGGRKIYFEKRTSSSDSQSFTTTADIFNDDTNWHHYAVTFDGTSTAKFYRDGTLIETQTFGGTSGIRSVTGRFRPMGDTDGASAEYFAHIRFSNSARTSFPYAILPSEVTVAQGSETGTQPPASTFTHFAGTNTGKIYQYDGAGGWDKVFDLAWLEWYETGTDTNGKVGDDGGTEHARAQSFQVDDDVYVEGVELYLRKSEGTPGDITVRIETNNAGVPSGTLAHANATTTIPAFATTDYGWLTATFTPFLLTGATTYHIVVKTAAAANDTNYEWAADASSPSYSAGQGSTSTDGGSTWSAASGTDHYFRLRGTDTSVNCTTLTTVGGTQKILFGAGDLSSEYNGDARLYSYDGTAWVLEEIFNTATQSAILSMSEYTVGGTKTLFVGIAPEGELYKSTDLASFTLSKDLDKPQNPGYPYFLYEYNKLLYAGGGSPEFLNDKYYGGFMYQFNQVDWEPVFPFDYTVLKSAQFYDAFMFIGSYHGQVFVFNTVTLDPLFDFAEDYDFQVQVGSMGFFDDKLWFGLIPQSGITPANEGIWIFNRHGMHQSNVISGADGYYSFAQVNNFFHVGTGNGYVYQRSNSQYEASGWLQTSYFDALLPSINKLYNDCTVQYAPLPEGCSIVVYYKFKESDSWTSLGTVDEVGSTSTTLTFPSGIISKKISLKFELTTSDASKTPEIQEYILKYALYPARKWQWNIRLIAKNHPSLQDGSLDPRTGIQIQTDLVEAQAAEKLNTFIDIDGKTYSILFHDLDQESWVMDPDNEGIEDTVGVTLLEG